MIAVGGICLIIGMLIGRFFRDPEYDNDCPAIEQGYRCKADLCDHRLSTLYEVKANMAKAAEEREAEQRWKGPYA
jgi:hypothetical protein